MFAHKGQNNIVDYFPVQNCSLDMGQHAQVTFLCNAGTCRLRQHCIGYFPAKTFLCTLGQHCTSNVDPETSGHHCRLFFPALFTVCGW